MFHLFDVNFGRIVIHSFHGIIYSTISRNRSVSKKQKVTPWLSSCHKSTQCLATTSNIYQRHQVDRRRRSCFKTKLNQWSLLNCSQECVNFGCAFSRVLLLLCRFSFVRETKSVFLSMPTAQCFGNRICCGMNYWMSVVICPLFLWLRMTMFFQSIPPSCVSFLWFDRNGMVNNATLYRRHCQ